MWAYRTTGILIKILRIPLTILSLFTTFISGIVSAIPLIGLVYVLVVSLIWQLFFWPLVGGAWLWMRLPPWLSWPVALLGIPVALLGDTFLKIVGALSADPDDRLGHFTKQSICQQWPYPFTRASDGRHVLEGLQRDENYSFVRAVIELNDSLTRRQLGMA